MIKQGDVKILNTGLNLKETVVVADLVPFDKAYVVDFRDGERKLVDVSWLSDVPPATIENARLVLLRGPRARELGYSQSDISTSIDGTRWRQDEALPSGTMLADADDVVPDTPRIKVWVRSHDHEPDETCWLCGNSRRRCECKPIIVLEEETFTLDVDTCFVNVYHVNRVWGGPEEGGWWYDAEEIKASVPSSYDASGAMYETLFNRFHYLDDPQPLHNVNSDGKLRIRIEDEPGRNTPRPHYE